MRPPSTSPRTIRCPRCCGHASPSTWCSLPWCWVCAWASPFTASGWVCSCFALCSCS